LFEDRFAGAYPILEVISQQAVTAPPQSFAITYRPSTRLSDPDSEDSTRRFNHGQIFSFLISSVVGAAVYPYEFEIPDLCDAPWLEYVRVPASPDASLFPFRQIKATPPQPPQAHPFFDYRRPNWWYQAEPDFRARNYALDLYPFRQQRVTPIPPILQGPWVLATSPGYYAGVKRFIGDIFQLNSLNDFASSTVNFDGTFSPFSGWMTLIPGNPQTIEQAQSLVVTGLTQVPGVPLPRTIL
jgi:hypothetical protein